MARLLVVDDDPQMLSLSKRYLAGTGYDILTAADFRDARMQIQLFEPAIIVADVRLGEYNGVQLALLALEAREDAGVVLMSGHADVVLQQEARQSGWQYLTKPFSKRDLLLSIAQSGPSTTM
jgi:DNA-binding response OmpR family regulator